MKKDRVKSASVNVLDSTSEAASLFGALLKKPVERTPDREPSPARTRREQYFDSVVDAFADPANEAHLISQGYTIAQLQAIREKYAAEGLWREAAVNQRDVLSRDARVCDCCGGDE